MSCASARCGPLWSGIGTSIGANGLATAPLALAGSEELKQRYLGMLTEAPLFAKGEVERVARIHKELARAAGIRSLTCTGTITLIPSARMRS